jgi:hypothetical protein
MFPAYAHSVQFFKILFDLDFQHAKLVRRKIVHIAKLRFIARTILESPEAVLPLFLNRSSAVSVFVVQETDAASVILLPPSVFLAAVFISQSLLSSWRRLLTV